MAAKKTSSALILDDNNSRQTVILQQPIKRGEHEIEQVQVRTPKAGELRGLALSDLLNLDVNTLKTLLPRITAPSLNESEIADLAPADLVKLGGKVINFLVPKETEEVMQA
ncbi:phage tail assembly protein [Gammaproteobacteria bacterium AS21]